MRVKGKPSPLGFKEGHNDGGNWQMKLINLASLDRRRKIGALIVIILVAVGIGVGFNLWYQSSRYITTDNARISAPLIPISALGTNQIISLDVDLGSYVERGQRVAEVGQPRVSDSTNMRGFKAVPTSPTGVEAPVSGYVAAIWAYPGAVITTGQPIMTLYDSSNVWVTANIEETKMSRVHPGQTVKIKVDSLRGVTLEGKVEGIAAATAATFSLIPQQATTGTFIKVVQVVPVKIAIEKPDSYVLLPGTSVEVKISTR
jgi:multidrug resistance efflux pump